jgi:hypothetical protein
MACIIPPCILSIIFIMARHCSSASLAVIPAKTGAQLLEFDQLVHGVLLFRRRSRKLTQRCSGKLTLWLGRDSMDAARRHACGCHENSPNFLQSARGRCWIAITH